MTKEYYFYHDTSVEHLENMQDELIDIMAKEWEDGGSYIGDRLKITINVEYEPEDK